MCLPIQNILALAKQTFSREVTIDGSKQRVVDDEMLLENLNKISSLMKELHTDDLGLEHSPSLFPDTFRDTINRHIDYSTEVPDLLPEEYDKINGHNPDGDNVPHSKAPVTYISVYEDADFSMSVFIVDGHARIPLHNHPDMHGLLQIVQGTLEVSCYNKIPLSDIEPNQLPNVLKDKKHLLEKGYIVPAEKVMHREPKDNTSGPLILEPTRDNYHEIRNVGDKPAAFLDILAPPYTHEEADQSPEQGQQRERRHCDFYKIARSLQKDEGSLSNQKNNGLEKKTHWLQVAPTPPDYFCDFEPYCGPPVTPPS